MKFSIEAQAEGLYLFNLSANLEPNTYNESQEVYSFLQKCKSLTKDTIASCTELIKEYKELEESYTEFGDAVLLSFARNILLYKVVTLYPELLKDLLLLQNLR